MAENSLFMYKFIVFVYIIINILTLVFCIWTTELLKNIFYLLFFLIFITSLYENIFLHSAFHFKVSFIINNTLCFHCMNFLYVISHIILIISLFCGFIIIKRYNCSNYDKYLKNCPFTLTEGLTTFSEDLYDKRICILYNVNMQNIYKYQYICSYNAFEDFEGEITENGLERIICESIENNLQSNRISDKSVDFYLNQERKDNMLYYCGRIDKPEKDNYIKDEYCNKELNIPYLISYLYGIINLLILYHIYLFNKWYRALSIRINNMLDDFNQNIIGLNYNSDSSTETDETDSEDTSFSEEDINIIIENKQVYNINFDIRDYYVNEE